MENISKDNLTQICLYLNFKDRLALFYANPKIYIILKNDHVTKYEYYIDKKYVNACRPEKNIFFSPNILENNIKDKLFYKNGKWFYYHFFSKYQFPIHKEPLEYIKLLANPLSDIVIYCDGKLIIKQLFNYHIKFGKLLKKYIYRESVTYNNIKLDKISKCLHKNLIKNFIYSKKRYLFTYLDKCIYLDKIVDGYLTYEKLINVDHETLNDAINHIIKIYHLDGINNYIKGKSIYFGNDFINFDTIKITKIFGNKRNYFVDDLLENTLNIDRYLKIYT